MTKKLVTTTYRPEGTPKGSIVLVHGMQEHRRRYKYFGEFFAARGYTVFTFDLPGHGDSVLEGESLGFFGDKGGWDLMLSSIRKVMEQAKSEYPDVPLIVYGHSMGSILCRCLLQTDDDKLDACVLSGAPAYTPAVTAGKALAQSIKLKTGSRGFSKTLDNMITGAFNKGIENPRTPLDWLSYEVENVDKYIMDPLCGVPFTVGGYIDLLDGMARMNNVKRYQAKKTDLPILFIAGQEDPCIGGEKGYRASVRTLQNAGYWNVTFNLYPGMRHEIHNEEGRDKVLGDVVTFLDRNLK